MPEVVIEETTVVEVPEIDYERLVTEDDKPVDNLFSEKQQRLLVEPLYSSWNPGTPFLAAANVGIFSSPDQPPIVPDMFLSLDVQADEDLWKKQNRSYYVWKFDKPPEVVVEIVSNRQGEESEKKFRRYARIGVWYYLIFDPQQLIQEELLQVYQLSLGRYVLKPDHQLDQVGLRGMLWDGVFEGLHERWLRWGNADGILIPTGEEGRTQERQQTEQERQRAEQERQRAEQERQRAEQAEAQALEEQQRAERLAAQLRALGVEPDDG
jgi:Uma2 family endonuclease